MYKGPIPIPQGHLPWDVLKDKRIIRIYDNEHGPARERVQVAWVQAVTLLERSPSSRFAAHCQSSRCVHRIALQTRGQSTQLVAVVFRMLGRGETTVRRNVQ